MQARPPAQAEAQRADIAHRSLRAARTPLIARAMSLPTTDEPRPTALSQRVGGLLAALGLVVALMVSLPLVQLLQHQNAQAKALAAAQARLDPLAQAVGVQRALLAHRDLAALVLTGHDKFEPERRDRERDVDQQLSALASTLRSGRWLPAIEEADALRADWRLLADNCAGRRLAAGESHQAHRLLVEQTLQIIDLLDAAGVPQPTAAGQAQPTALAAAHALPRMAWKLALLGLTAGSGASAQLDQVVQASEGVQGPKTAQTTAIDAQFAKFQRAHAEAAEQLAAQLAAVQLHVGWLVIGMLALAAVALRLAFAVATRLRHLVPEAHATGQPAGAGLAPVQASLPPRQHAGALLDRLREGRAGSDRTKRDPQATIQPPPP